MAGAEFTRIHSWGIGPARKVCSAPTQHPSWFQQLILLKGRLRNCEPLESGPYPSDPPEPILIRHATCHGYQVTFNTAPESFTEDAKSELLTAVIRDEISNLEYKIKTKYLFGADGAQSQVVKQIDLPLIHKPGQGIAINVLVKADLSHLVDSRQGNLHWVVRPDREHSESLEMTPPWKFLIFPSGSPTRFLPKSILGAICKKPLYPAATRLLTIFILVTALVTQCIGIRP